MFAKKTLTESELDKAISRVHLNMADTTPWSEDYQVMNDQLAKLYAIKKENLPNRVSKDTLAIVAGNLLGIMMIVGHERANVIGSKALAFVMKASR